VKKIKDKQSAKMHVFEGKMTDYENQLVQIFKSLGAAVYTSDKTMTIYGYILIHHRLTQKQLRDLTGYSLCIYKE